MSAGKIATAFAPATVANVAVGFDVLGFALEGIVDEITVEATSERKVTLVSVQGADLPQDPARNTASVALLAMLEELDLPHGFRVRIKKGIPLSSGMGGSAASAVGAVVAANALLKAPVSLERQAHFALQGEKVASGAIHADNVSPCLYGGLTISLSTDPVRVVRVPVPPAIRCVLVHPKIQVRTRDARKILKPQILLAEHVSQSACLAGFISACHSGDLNLIRETMLDLIVGPQRAPLIPGFEDARSAALREGALGFSISGSGPSVFAWTASDADANRVRESVIRAFTAAGVESEGWVGPVSEKGTRVEVR